MRSRCSRRSISRTRPTRGSWGRSDSRALAARPAGAPRSRPLHHSRVRLRADCGERFAGGPRVRGACAVGSACAAHAVAHLFDARHVAGSDSIESRRRRRQSPLCRQHEPGHGCDACANSGPLSRARFPDERVFTTRPRRARQGHCRRTQLDRRFDGRRIDNGSYRFRRDSRALRARKARVDRGRRFAADGDAIRASRCDHLVRAGDRRRAARRRHGGRESLLELSRIARGSRIPATRTGPSRSGFRRPRPAHGSRSRKATSRGRSP